MDRLEKIRGVVDRILNEQQDIEERRCGFAHLYGVSAICSLMSLKRGMDPQISSIAGMLHDIYVYRTRLVLNHAHNSEEYARVILRETGDFTDEEQKVIRSAIFRHSDKETVHEPYDELLKDADVLQHFLYNTSLPVAEKELIHLKNVLSEFGLSDEHIEVKTPNKTEIDENSISDKRNRLADLAEALAKENIVGDAHDTNFLTIIRYWPDDDIVGVLKSAWCAAFVYHCCMQVGFTLPIKYTEPVPCRFAGVKAWLVWSQLPEINFYHPADQKGFMPERGDIVIYEDIVGNGPHDHIGIVMDFKDGIITTAEGNVENRSGIFMRDRYKNINGFIRIDNSYVYK